MRNYLDKSAKTHQIRLFKMCILKNTNKTGNSGEGRKESSVRTYMPYKFKVFLNFFCFGHFLEEHLLCSSVLQINYYILLTHGKNADIKYRTQMHRPLCYIAPVSLPIDILQDIDILDKVSELHRWTEF